MTGVRPGALSAARGGVYAIQELGRDPIRPACNPPDTKATLRENAEREYSHARYTVSNSTPYDHTPDSSGIGCIRNGR